MKSEDEIRAMRAHVETAVDRGIALGCPKAPTTALEHHAWQMGRLSALMWAAPEPPPEPKEQPVAENEAAGLSK